jgi:hypothetical protein
VGPAVGVQHGFVDLAMGYVQPGETLTELSANTKPLSCLTGKAALWYNLSSLAFLGKTGRGRNEGPVLSPVEDRRAGRAWDAVGPFFGFSPSGAVAVRGRWWPGVIIAWVGGKGKEGMADSGWGMEDGGWTGVQAGVAPPLFIGKAKASEPVAWPVVGCLGGGSHEKL